MTKAEQKNETLSGLLCSIAETAGYMWQKGWAEKNAGNISVNLKGIADVATDDNTIYPHRDLPSSFGLLAGECFLVTGTGKRMRDIARDPLNNALIIRIDEKGNGYYIIPPSVKQDVSDLRPTSELPTHLSVHSMIKARGSRQRVVIHTHVTELVALTQLAGHCNEIMINRILWGMHPEAKVFIPEGAGFVPYIIPGSAEIAHATVEAFQKHDVTLWEKHGVFAIGETVSDAFDLIDILAKSASIYFTCKAAGMEPEGLTDKQIDELGKIIL